MERTGAKAKIANRIAPRRSPRPSFVFLRAKKIPPIIAGKKRRMPAILPILTRSGTGSVCSSRFHGPMVSKLAGLP